MPTVRVNKRRKWEPRDRRGGRRGQSLVEFALIAPMLVGLVFSIVEAGTLLYVYNSAQHAATLGQRVIAAEGTVGTTDVDAVDVIHGTDFGNTALVSITEIDVYRLAPDGSNTRTSAGCPMVGGNAGCFESYVLGSCPGGVSCLTHTTAGGVSVSQYGNWPPAVRNTTSSGADYVEMDLHYKYQFFANSGSSLSLTVTRLFRLEPQSS